MALVARDHSLPSQLKIKAMIGLAEVRPPDSSGRQDTGRPEVKGQIAEIHIFDRQQFESVSVCSFDPYQTEET